MLSRIRKLAKCESGSELTSSVLPWFLLEVLLLTSVMDYDLEVEVMVFITATGSKQEPSYGYPPLAESTKPKALQVVSTGLSHTSSE